jgi:plastocyanin
MSNDPVVGKAEDSALVEMHVRLSAKRGASTRQLTFGAALAAIAATLAVPGLAPAGTHSNTLIGTDGPGFTITMSKKTVKPGTYTIVVNDKSNIHNFHLTGPGVNKLTSIPWVGTKTWTVTLKKGVYRSSAIRTRQS